MGDVKPVKEYLESLIGKPLKEGEVTFLNWKATCVVNDPELYDQIASKANAELRKISYGDVHWVQPFTDKTTDPRWYIEIRGNNARMFLSKYGKKYDLK